MNHDFDALYFELRVPFDPFSAQGFTWLKDARDALAVSRERTGLNYYLASEVASNVDTVNAVYDMFPYAVAATLTFVFMLVGVAFRSLVVPIRTVLSLGLNLAFVYGSAVLVYQYGTLDWMGVATLHSQGQLSWLTPIMTFSVVVGLGLDYDVFLITRIFEYRKAGLSERNSIFYGLSQTGPIITAAGCIMAIAFVGLLFSEIEGLNQLSFFLVIAVLLDTFVVRSILVPNMMLVLGKLNWWPLKYPVTEDDYGSTEALNINAE